MRRITAISAAAAALAAILAILPARGQTLTANSKGPTETVCTGKPLDPSICFGAGAQAADRVELQMFDLINRDRTDDATLPETRGQAHPLQWDARLAAVARAHSEEMMRARYFAHEGADGSLPSDRVSRAGIQWLAVGENIAKARDVRQARDLFMDEPKFERNHRGNILGTEYTHVGVGIAKGPDGLIYVTEEFARLR